MTVDPAVVPGLLLLALELLALAAVGYVVARVALQQTDDWLALAQGLVIGLALWGLIVSFLLHLLPGQAGAIAGWAVMLALGASLVWRSPFLLRIPPRTVAGFVGAALGLSWIAMTGRQLLTIPDPQIHLGLSAAIRAGVYPPELPWNPGLFLPYHYGVDLLIGLLQPPIGPDAALTTEVLGAYAWASLALVTVMTVRKGGSWSAALVLAALMLTPGTWTLLLGDQPPLLKVPVPTGLPSAGLRAALTDVYWPATELPDAWALDYETPPPNVWKPPISLAYALAVVVLERVSARGQMPWLANSILALLVGFLGLVEETVALTILGLWVLLAALGHISARPDRTISRGLLVRSGLGPALAALLLVAGGGPITGLLTGGLGGSLTLGLPGSLGDSLLLGSIQPLAGGLGLLGLGGIPVAGAALLLAWRQRLVVALVVGSSVFMVASLVLQFGAFDFDVGRLDGHAQNLALLALMLALTRRLHVLNPRWRYAAAGCLVALVVWPTISTPVLKVGLALDRGVKLSNAQPESASDAFATVWHAGRYVLVPAATETITAHIRDHTPLNARVLSPDPINLSINTGRSTASGFAGHLHLFPIPGPDYQDSIRYLEPAAVRRLGYSYVHATDAWIDGLPDQAQQRLANPQLFAPIVRDGAHALYAIQPAFLQLQPPPDPQSFEALRQAVPASATVRMSAGVQTLEALRVGSALPEAKLLGTLNPSNLYLLTEIPIEPVSDALPDVVVLARDRAMNASTHSFPVIWWNHAAIAYATSSAVTAVTTPPPQPESNFAVRISDVRTTANRIAFATTFIDHASTQWTGQDWLVIPVDPSPWSLPTSYAADGYSLVGARWYAGQIVPSSQPVRHRYEFDGDAQQLAVQGTDWNLDVLPSSGDQLAPGSYVLAVRLRHNHLQAAIIPVLKMAIANDGQTSYETFGYDRRATVDPCPERLQNTESCRRLAADS